MALPRAMISLADLARLSQMSLAELTAFAERPVPGHPFKSGTYYLDGPSPAGKFGYLAALRIEVARQLSDDGWLPFSAAMDAVIYTGALSAYSGDLPAPRFAPDQDYWVAVLGARTNWGAQPREGWPATGFGPGEVWTQGHFDGTYDVVVGAIKSRIIRDTMAADADGNEPDDFARVLLANVSAADRRLRKRAAALGINLGDA